MLHCATTLVDIHLLLFATYYFVFLFVIILLQISVSKF